MKTIPSSSSSSSATHMPILKRKSEAFALPILPSDRRALQRLGMEELDNVSLYAPVYAPVDAQIASIYAQDYAQMHRLNDGAQDPTSAVGSMAVERDLESGEYKPHLFDGRSPTKRLKMQKARRTFPSSSFVFLLSSFPLTSFFP